MPASARADAAADERIDAQRFQKARQRAVAAAVRGRESARDDFAVLDVIHRECLGVAEVAEHIPVFVCDCDPHLNLRFLSNIKAA